MASLVQISVSSPIHIPLPIPRAGACQDKLWSGQEKKERIFFSLPAEQCLYRELPSLREITQTSQNVDLDRKLIWPLGLQLPVPQTDLVLISMFIAKCRLTKPAAPTARVKQAVAQGRQMLHGCCWCKQLWALSGYFPFCHWKASHLSSSLCRAERDI